MLAALGRALERFVRPGVAIKPKQRENRARGAGRDVELPVGRDEVVGEQARRCERVGEQRVVAETFRHLRQRVNEGAQTRGAPEPQRARDARGVSAAQRLAQVRDGGQRKFG